MGILYPLIRIERELAFKIAKVSKMLLDSGPVKQGRLGHLRFWGTGAWDVLYGGYITGGHYGDVLVLAGVVLQLTRIRLNVLA